MAVQWQRNCNLKSRHTFGFEALARRFAVLKAPDDLAFFFREGRAPELLLGGGSNLLFVDEVYEEVVVNALQGKTVLEESEEEVLLSVASGENWHNLVLWTLERAWYGLENLALIPGTVGAAPIQNIGAYGVELESVLEEVVALEWRSGSRRVFSREACRLGYRDSYFKREGRGRYFIERVVLRLRKQPQPNLSYAALRQKLEEQGISQPSPREVCRAVMEIRRSKLPDPAILGNAGSFFKNPVLSGLEARSVLESFPQLPHYPLDFDESGRAVRIKVPAAWLIEQCGWKGVRRGNVGVHEHQALVLVHYGGGRGREVLDLAEEIRQSVCRKFSIQLEYEVQPIFARVEG